MSRKLETKGYVYISGEVRRRTEKAIQFFDGTRTEWIPKSQIEDGDDVEEGHTELLLPEWLAKEKGFI